MATIRGEAQPVGASFFALASQETNSLRRPSSAVVCLVAWLLPAVQTLADSEAPAVSTPNAKVSVEGGQYDDDGSALALGSYTIPLGHSFGLQADGALGNIADDVMGGGGVHSRSCRPELCPDQIFASAARTTLARA